MHVPDDTAARLTAALAGGLPLSLRPYADIGAALGMPGAEVVASARQLREARALRRVGASFSPVALGYHASLGAVAMPEDGVEQAAAEIAAVPCVTHVFEIDDRYRLWYVIVAPSRARLDIAESDLASRVGANDRYRVLPDERFKVTAAFDADGAPEPVDADPDSDATATLDRDEKALLRLLQGDFPLAERPFSDLAITLGECGYDIDERWALETTRGLVAAGGVRGIAATLRMREEPWRLALTVWLGATDIAAACTALGSFPEVLHSFERRVPGAGPAALALVEAPDRSTLDQTIARMGAVADLDAPRIAFPLREFHRGPMRYFAEGE